MKTVERNNINIEDVKNEVKQNIGTQIKIYSNNKNGKRVKEYIGEILSAYDSLFIVKVQIRNNFLNKSFSYVDFLTNEMTYLIL